MKKTMIILSLFLVAFATKVVAQTITIRNQSSCDVYVTLYAHDNGCLSTTCGGYVSNITYVAAGTHISFNAEAGVNDITTPCATGTGPGWNLGCYALLCMPSGAPWGWDGAEINEPSFTSDIFVGGGSCFGSTTGNSSPDCNVPSNTVYGYWVVGTSSVDVIIT